MYIIIACILIFTIILFFTIIYIKYKHNLKTKNEHILQQKKLTKVIVDTQETERKKIAQELHDNIGQQLTVLKINYEKIKDNSNFCFSENNVVSEHISNMIDNIHKDVRSISHHMMPRFLREKNFTYAIIDLLDKTLSKTDIKYQLHNNILVNLPEDIKLCLYRVMQELLNNIIKHSKANEISIQLIYLNNNIIMMVEDNGIGIKFKSNSENGIGLDSIKARVNVLGGFFLIENSAFNGTIATIRIPFIQKI